MREIIVKEFRDLIRWSPLAILLGLVMVFWMALPANVYGAVGIDRSLRSTFGLTAAIIAIAYGFLQSLFDIRNDARGYLLHRPVSQEQIFTAKLVAGFVVYVISLVPAFLLAAIHLAWKGIEILPTSPWQLLPAVYYCLPVFLLHPTAIWIANRDARWVGTRLLPAAGTIGGLFFLTMIERSIMQPTMLYYASLAFGLVFAFAIVLFGARHAFTKQSHLPPASATNRHRSAWSIIGLTISAVVFCGTIITFAFALVPSQQRDYVSYSLELDHLDQWQELRSTHSTTDWNRISLAKRPIGSDQPFQPLTNATASPGVVLKKISDMRLGYGRNYFRMIGYFVSESTAGGQVVVVENRQRLLVYAGQRDLIAIVTPDGVFTDAAKATGRFAGQVTSAPLGTIGRKSITLTTQQNPLLSDDEALYQLNVSKLTIRRLDDQPWEAIGLMLSDDDRMPVLWRRYQNKLTQYDITPIDPTKKLPRPDSKSLLSTRQIKMPEVTIKPGEHYQVEPPNRWTQLRLLRRSDGKTYLVRSQTGQQVRYRLLASASEASSNSMDQFTEVELTPNTDFSENEWWVGLCVPPCFFATISGIYMLFSNEPSVPRGIPWRTLASLLVHAVIAAAVAYALSLRRGLSRNSRVAWTISGATFGIGTILAILSIYPKLVTESCPECRSKRRVDLDDCEHCGQRWDPPADEGIEIIDRGKKIPPMQPASKHLPTE